MSQGNDNDRVTIIFELPRSQAAVLSAIAYRLMQRLIPGEKSIGGTGIVSLEEGPTAQGAIKVLFYALEQHFPSRVRE